MRMQVCKSGSLTCGYAQYSAVNRVLSMGGAAVDDTDFGQDVTLRFHIAPARIPALTQALADATAGSAAPAWTGESFYPTDEG